MFRNRTSWTAILLFVSLVLIFLTFSFGITYEIVGWVNVGFHMGLTDTQVLIASVVAWIILSALGGRGVSVSIK